jgi:hypothetical protein
MRARWQVAGLLAACASGVAACAAVAPTPPIAAPSAGGSTPASTPLVSAPPSSFPTPPPDDLRTEIQVVSVDPSVTHPLLEFVSDGESVVFSSGRADDAGPDAAPDLWRIVPPRAEPNLLWRNPEREHAIVKIAGDLGLIAFVEIPLTGERAWNLWLLPRGADAPILLDRHPGDEDVSSLVPSLAVSEETVAWTAFDSGPDGPVSQLLIARAPDWRAMRIHQVPAAEAEIWLPSLRGSTLAYAEVHYSPDRSSDERHVYLTTTAPGAERRRLDDSGLATMPVVVDGAVLWKEADRGFNMFNWGRMFRYDLSTNAVTRLDTAPQPDVNYPSAGSRFVTWWGADSFWLTVYDLARDEPRLVARNRHESQESEFEPHIAGDLLVWRHVAPLDPDDRGELRYAFLPPLREPR